MQIISVDATLHQGDLTHILVPLSY